MIASRIEVSVAPERFEKRVSRKGKNMKMIHKFKFLACSFLIAFGSIACSGGSGGGGEEDAANEGTSSDQATTTETGELGSSEETTVAKISQKEAYQLASQLKLSPELNLVGGSGKKATQGLALADYEDHQTGAYLNDPSSNFLNIAREFLCVLGEINPEPNKKEPKSEKVQLTECLSFSGSNKSGGAADNKGKGGKTQGGGKAKAQQNKDTKTVNVDSSCTVRQDAKENKFVRCDIGYEAKQSQGAGDKIDIRTDIRIDISKPSSAKCPLGEFKLYGKKDMAGDMGGPAMGLIAQPNQKEAADSKKKLGSAMECFTGFPFRCVALTFECDEKLQKTTFEFGELGHMNQKYATGELDINDDGEISGGAYGTLGYGIDDFGNLLGAYSQAFNDKHFFQKQHNRKELVEQAKKQGAEVDSTNMEETTPEKCYLAGEYDEYVQSYKLFNLDGTAFGKKDEQMDFFEWQSKDGQMLGSADSFGVFLHQKKGSDGQVDWGAHEAIVPDGTVVYKTQWKEPDQVLPDDIPTEEELAEYEANPGVMMEEMMKSFDPFKDPMKDIITTTEYTVRRIPYVVFKRGSKEVDLKNGARFEWQPPRDCYSNAEVPCSKKYDQFEIKYDATAGAFKYHKSRTIDEDDWKSWSKPFKKIKVPKVVDELDPKNAKFKKDWFPIWLFNPRTFRNLTLSYDEGTKKLSAVEQDHGVTPMVSLVFPRMRRFFVRGTV